MKSLTTTILFLSFAVFACAQTDNQIQDSNNLRIKINSNGALFTDFEDGRFSPKPYGDIDLNLIESMGFWMMGVDDTGVLKGAIQKKNENGTADWFAGGILDSDDPIIQTIPELNKIWTVYDTDIEALLADFEDNDVLDEEHENIFAWPAVGNPFFEAYNGFGLPETSQGLAAFWDDNGTGTYDPDYGDFPYLTTRGCYATIVVPSVMSTFFITDAGLEHTASGTVAMDQMVQVTVFQFAFEEETPLNNTVFVKYKTYNYSNSAPINAKVAVNIDFAIGDKSDDYFGSNQERNLAFAYNSDNEDALFGTNPPVVAVDMLRGFIAPPITLDTIFPVPLERVFSLDYANANQSPQFGSQYFNIMNGFFPNGSAVSNSDFQFSDLPSSGGINSEASMGNTPGTRSALMVSEDFLYYPGAINEVVMAITYTDGGSVAENLDKMITDNDEVQAFFDNCFTTNFTPTTATKEQLIAEANISIYPNPTSSIVNIVTADELQEEVLLFDITGQLLQRIATQSKHTQLNVELLPKGSYVIKVKTESGIAAKHLVIQ